MADIKNIELVSSEISGLWDSYISDSLAICVLSHFLKTVEDNETRVLLQHTLDLSTQHIPIIKDIFNQEGLTIPYGFTNEDVNLNAPRLFTDTFYAAYISFMARVGMHNYTVILNQIARADIRDYFSKRVTECVDLYNKSAELRLSKGIFIKAPRIEVHKQVQFIESQSFIFDIFGEKRTLLAREITNIFALIFTNTMGIAVCTGFAQVSKNKEDSEYFIKGKHLSEEINKELIDLLIEQNIPIPATSESFVTDSTEPPFSEKLMLYHIMMMSTVGVNYKGMAMSQSMRLDLEAKYAKFMAKIMKYVKDGITIMNENRLIEQPPQAINHEKLVKK
ncbi:DUF3231 family protein [Clostridium sp. YIM B02515]|uniref:DUF3231 family protein n=1 Tax=Clostridium rhizosphaerae TaxID=2803861 RepID=A0ABS1T4E1_9CLOT|nr:DUF3231 family protein [Clostridium rhizosphaerae]MBL4934190.1 DUF3231 family protein [Clostridium rhizosphaerae]